MQLWETADDDKMISHQDTIYLDVMQFGLSLHLLFLVLRDAHFLHRRNAVSDELLIDHTGLREL
eukprot:1239238-Rhodomonas_salina.2